MKYTAQEFMCESAYCVTDTWVQRLLSQALWQFTCLLSVSLINIQPELLQQRFQRDYGLNAEYSVLGLLSEMPQPSHPDLHHHIQMYGRVQTLSYEKHVSQCALPNMNGGPK